MANELTKLKSNVKNLETNTDCQAVSIDEAESRGSAQRAISKLKTLAEKKLAEGFVLRRVPITGGYKEVWVKPEK